MSSPSSLCAAFQATARSRGDAPALVMRGHAGYTWSEYAAGVRRLAPGFAALGVVPGQAVALLTGPRPEFHLVDTALLHTGAVPCSLQVGDPVDLMARSVGLAGARVLVTEERFLPAARAVAAASDVAPTLVCVDARADDGVWTLDEVAALHGPDFDGMWRAVGSEDVATLIFTSGTTGAPKAVQLSHRAVLVSELSTHVLAPFDDVGGTVLSYLPLNHIADRFMAHYASLVHGVTVRSVPEADTLYEEIRRVRPSRFFGVPRVYEKLVDQAQAAIGADGRLAEALDASLVRVRAEQSGQPVPPERDRAADAGVAALAGVRRSLGLDRAEYLGVATAPSAYGMLEFLLALGLQVSDLWGMSEAIMCTLNPPGAIRLGTVGRFLDGVEGRIADDGEILVRGPNVFSGYLGDATRTAEILDAEGWIHTGDVGSIDNGYLTIRGRKKELLITATGKNIAPGAIEGALKSASPLIDHAVALADGRRYVAALIALDQDQLAAFAHERELPGGFADWTRHELVRRAVADAVAAANATLSRPETVRAFRIVDRAWPPGSAEVTPTAKVRRAEVARRYSDEIEQMYA